MNTMSWTQAFRIVAVTVVIGLTGMGAVDNDAYKVRPGDLQQSDDQWPNDINTWEWSETYGEQFPNAHHRGLSQIDLNSSSSPLLAEGWHVCEIRVTTGSGIDAFTFAYAQAVLDKDTGVWSWVGKPTPAHELDYIGKDYDDQVWLGQNQDIVNDHRLHVFQLNANERLTEIKVYSRKGTNQAIHGADFNCESLKGGTRTFEARGLSCDSKGPCKRLGKKGREIVQIKTYHGRAMDAIGVRHRAIDTSK